MFQKKNHNHVSRGTAVLKITINLLLKSILTHVFNLILILKLYPILGQNQIIDISYQFRPNTGRITEFVFHDPQLRFLWFNQLFLKGFFICFVDCSEIVLRFLHFL